MRALIVVGSLARGGAERQAILTCAALRECNVEATLFVLQPPLDLLTEHGEAAALLADDPTPRPTPARQVAALARVIAEKRSAVVISFLQSAHIRVLLARRVSAAVRSAAWVAAERGNFRLSHFSSNPLTTNLRRVALREADLVAVNSAALAGNIAAFTGELGSKLVIVPNVAPAEIKASPGAAERLRTLLGTNLPVPLIGAIGSFQPDRNYELLAHAFAEVIRERPTAHLVVFGRTVGTLCEPAANRMREVLAARGVAEHVTLAGDVPNARDFLPLLDAFVLPSMLEGSSNALAEALAAGAAIAATSVGDSESLAGGAARIANGWTPRALSSAILDVLRDPEVWRGRARERAGVLFSERSLARIGARWRETLVEAIERREALCAG